MAPENSPQQRPKILFISPIMPSDSGNGPAMRAALFIRALAKEYQIYLHIIPVLGAVANTSDTLNLEQLCAQVNIQKLQQDPVFEFINRISQDRNRLAALAGYHQVALCRFASKAVCSQIYQRYAAIDFAAIHVFRLYMAPFVEGFITDEKTKSTPICLDMDDYESQTHHRFADLFRHRQLSAEAYLETAEASKYEQMEQHWLPRFKHVYLSNEHDYPKLIKRFPTTSFKTLANAVTAISRAKTIPRSSKVITLLYVGTMSYFPNEDAVLYFCAEILPKLRIALACEINFIIAGAKPTERIRSLAIPTKIQVTGLVKDLAPLYQLADLIIAPLRAGGGTRIKILEAFAYQRPVVATTLALEGIAAINEKQVLIADDSAAFMQACYRLIKQPELAETLVSNAYQLVRQNYSQEIIAQQIQLTMQAVCAEGG